MRTIISSTQPLARCPTSIDKDAQPFPPLIDSLGREKRITTPVRMMLLILVALETLVRLAANTCSFLLPDRVTVPPPFPEVPPAHTPLDNSALQRYINAPTMKWRACLNPNDANRFAPPPVEYPSYPNNILAKVIESSKSGITIMHGLEDGRIISAGTQIVLQNLTWNCHQGFE